MKKTEISIIIPCYNCSNTIVETLKSIESSSYHDYEVIIVNDGSTDSSCQIINEYINNSELDIHLVNQNNLGVSVARNRGIEESKGEFLLFLDGDDLFAKGFIKCVSELMNRYYVDTLSCYRTENRNELMDIKEIEGHYSLVNAEKLLKQYTYSKTRLGFTSFVYRKSILDKYNIRFTPDVKYGEDWEFATKYLAHCYNAIEIYYTCYYYRILGNSVSRTVSFRQVDAIHAAERTAQYLHEIEHPFAQEFKDYMYPRSIFSVAHRFAKGKRKDYYQKLIEQYPVKEAMKRIKTSKFFDYKSRLAACAFSISQKLFFVIAQR